MTMQGDPKVGSPPCGILKGGQGRFGWWAVVAQEVFERPGPEVAEGGLVSARTIYKRQNQLGDVRLPALDLFSDGL